MYNHFFNKILLLLFVLCILSFNYVSYWGFQGHRIINRMAVFTLPKEMVIFFKKNIEYITENSTKPDSRRYSNKKEGAGHYIDIEYYENLDSLENYNWKKISSIISEDSLYKHGILPWRIIQYKYLLQKAFEKKSYEDIIKYASELGHYIADAHVPLHTTKNYNGQLTNQHGIHSLWETKVVNLISNEINYFTNKAIYIKNTHTFIWDIINKSHRDVQKVLEEEAILSKDTTIRKYTFPLQNEKKTYSEEFIKAYNTKLNGMVSSKMKQAIENLGSIWYTAWVDAGQPILSIKEIKYHIPFGIKNHECD
jgi:hypothetical protein